MIFWQSDWRAFDDFGREAEFLTELNTETGDANPQHALHGKECRIIGWRERGRKYFILYLPLEDRYAYVHLTWNPETDPRWPHCEFLENIVALNDFLMQWGDEK